MGVGAIRLPKRAWQAPAPPFIQQLAHGPGTPGGTGGGTGGEDGALTGCFPEPIVGPGSG